MRFKRTKKDTKDAIKEILIDASEEGKGFDVILITKDGPWKEADNMSLAEAMGCATGIGNLVALNPKRVRVSKEAIERNKFNDLDAMKASNAIKSGVKLCHYR